MARTRKRLPEADVPGGSAGGQHRTLGVSINKSFSRHWSGRPQRPTGRLQNRARTRLENTSHHKLSQRPRVPGFMSQNGLMRQLGYTRVSTSSQDAQLQLDALVSAGVQKRDVFADVTSGSKTAIERPGMKRLLEYAEEGDTVVVWRVDRLGRSLIDVLNTVNLLRERGIQVRSISDGIDPTTSTGRLMLNMLATLAEYERELIVERVNAGIAAARQNGTRFGRPLTDPIVIADKLAIAQDARAKGRTAEDAARLVGWSRATLYRHQQALAAHKSTTM